MDNGQYYLFWRNCQVFFCNFCEYTIWKLLGQKTKAAVGFEPTNNGFANRPLRPLGYAAKLQINGILSGNRHFRNIFYRRSVFGLPNKMGAKFDEEVDEY
jgi:hypothetical protein